MGEIKLYQNAKFNNFEIVGQGSVSVASTGLSGSGPTVQIGTDSTSVTHSLGFAPLVMAFEGDSGGYEQMPHIGYTESSSNYYYEEMLTAWSDSTTIHIDILKSLIAVAAGAITTGTSSYEITYYLLRERAAA